MTTTAARMVWMDTLEPGSVLEWTFFDANTRALRTEWVTVLNTRPDGDITWAIVVRENGEQDAVSSKHTRPVRIRMTVDDS